MARLVHMTAKKTRLNTTARPILAPSIPFQTLVWCSSRNQR